MEGKMDVGDILSLVVVFAIGILLFSVGVSELRRYFWPEWRTGYRRLEPSLGAGLSWLAIGIICIGMVVAMLCAGGEP
jgi:hypothetical protein